MSIHFMQFRAAILDLIELRRSRLDALVQSNPDLEAELADLEAACLDLADKTTPAEREAIGEFYGVVLAVLGSKEEMFQAVSGRVWLRLLASV